MPLQGFNNSKADLVGISDYAYPTKSLSTPVKDIRVLPVSEPAGFYTL